MTTTETTAEDVKADDIKDQVTTTTPKQEDDDWDLPETFTAADLEGLSKAERAEILGAEAEEPPTEQDETTPTDEAEEPAPKAQQEPEPDPTTQPEPTTSAASVQTAYKEADDAIKAAEDLISTAKADRKALFDKFDAGDIDRDEFEKLEAELFDKTANAQADLKVAQKTRDKASTDWQAIEKAWYQKTDAFHAQHPELVTTDHATGWDQELRSVFAANPAMTHDQIIALAFKRYAVTAEVMGKPLTKTASAPAVAKAQDKPKLEARTDPRPPAPQTLAQVPASDPSRPGNDSRFGAISDMIDGATTGTDVLRAEQAMARMSDDEIDAMLREAG